MQIDVQKGDSTLQHGQNPLVSYLSAVLQTQHLQLAHVFANHRQKCVIHLQRTYVKLLQVAHPFHQKQQTLSEDVRTTALVNPQLLILRHCSFYKL